MAQPLALTGSFGWDLNPCPINLRTECSFTRHHLNRRASVHIETPYNSNGSVVALYNPIVRSPIEFRQATSCKILSLAAIYFVVICACHVNFFLLLFTDIIINSYLLFRRKQVTAIQTWNKSFFNYQFVFIVAVKNGRSN